MNETNLLKLADAIEGLDPELFDISSYRMDVGMTRPFKSIRDCGTIGCALGWAPFVIPTETSDFLGDFLYWGAYCRRVFGLNDGEWNWCFSDGWEDTDNTPTGASLRIRELVINGLPKDTRAQRIGNATYKFGGLSSEI